MLFYFIRSETDLTVDPIAAYRELTPTVDVRTNDTEISVTFSKKRLFPNPLDFLGMYRFDSSVLIEIKSSSECIVVYGKDSYVTS